jgi:hypothetical protein
VSGHDRARRRRITRSNWQGANTHGQAGEMIVARVALTLPIGRNALLMRIDGPAGVVMMVFVNGDSRSGVAEIVGGPAGCGGSQERPSHG